MLHKISISNKCCSFKLSIHQRILKNLNALQFPQKYEAAQLFSTLIIIRNVSDWSIDAEKFSFDHSNKLYFNIYSQRKLLFCYYYILNCNSISQYCCFSVLLIK